MHLDTSNKFSKRCRNREFPKSIAREVSTPHYDIDFDAYPRGVATFRKQEVGGLVQLRSARSQAVTYLHRKTFIPRVNFVNYPIQCMQKGLANLTSQLSMAVHGVLEVVYR